MSKDLTIEDVLKDIKTLCYPGDFGKDKFDFTEELIIKYNGLYPDVFEIIHSNEFINGFKKETIHKSSYSEERLKEKVEILAVLVYLWSDYHCPPEGLKKNYLRTQVTEQPSDFPEYVKFIANLITQLIPVKEEDRSIYWDMVHEFDAEDFQSFCILCFNKKYPWSYVKDIIEKYYEWNQNFHWTTYTELTKDFPCEVLSDSSEIERLCQEAMDNNIKSVEDYKKGKMGALNHIKGQVMKLSKGKADIQQVNAILERKLKS